jgi:UDP-N-acetylmuramate: L-alanyl-gamma-D-glutamyl-meso-diaminopimelate ligase
MGGIALLARAKGHKVTGSDQNVYPPMSTQLENAGIELMRGYDASHLDPAPDVVVVGNAMSRGNPAVEYMLDKGLPYTSGPQWLAEHILQDKWVLGVAGTHGKTSTSALLAWVLEFAGLKPGFLIGGVPENFGVSARSSESVFFVVEADEYDTAFFDKRSKFIHYHPRTLIMNNLEFDHADIFDDLEQIQKQFHFLVRTVPSSGLIITPLIDGNVQHVLDMGCWTGLEHFDVESSAQWHAELVNADGSEFKLVLGGQVQGTVKWDLIGHHNVSNALAAIAAARHAGVPVKAAIEALAEFVNVKRRMELRGEARGVKVYDDFAHHPTAILTTMQGLRDRVGGERIIAVLEPRSNTMKMGFHARELPESLAAADAVFVLEPQGISWDVTAMFSSMHEKAKVFSSTADIIDSICEIAKADDHVLIMSNGGFENIHQRLLEQLESQ